MSRPPDDNHYLADDHHRKTALFMQLTQFWSILFEASRMRHSNQAVTTFSELAESYLLSTEHPTLKTCCAAVFIYLTVETRIVTFDSMLRLLMDHMASRVCQSGYATGQYVLQLLLEEHLSSSSTNNGRHSKTSEKAVTTTVIESATATASSASVSSSDCSVSAAAGPLSIDNTANVYLMQQMDAMKILVRIYLGKLKSFDVQLMADAAGYTKRSDQFQYMRQNLAAVFEHHQCNDGWTTTMSQHSADRSKHKQQFGILYMAARPAYLDIMFPMHAANSATSATNDMELTIVKFQVQK